MLRKAYSPDLNDCQWRLIQPFLPPPVYLGRHRTTELREGVNAIRYVLRSCGAWRLLPHDFPPWQTVYAIFVLGWPRGSGNASIPHSAKNCARKLVAKPRPVREPVGENHLSERVSRL